ncbi:probable ABSCISIC ACID-INSENSITIVE 5-like protein 2 [Coccomyxa sp. Obi]|nr:probable ABSCISIC ACID-INSENSITIVE 5-like protein 2 [Coccomyxa sp. Obi]
MGTLQRQTTLSRQTSAVFQMTLDQLQQSVGSGKPFGSMNMEEFLAAVWDRDAGGVPPPLEAGYNQPESVPAFQYQQPPAPLHPDYSGKTVEEVWNSIHKSNGNSNGEQQPGLPTFQTVTLGSFLERVGVDFPSMDLQQNGLLPPAPELQVHTYYPQVDGAVHITQSAPMRIKKDPTVPFSAFASQPFEAHPLPPRASRRTARPSYQEQEEAVQSMEVVEGRPWPLQRPPSPPLSMPQTPSHSPTTQQGANGQLPGPSSDPHSFQPSTSAPQQGGHGAAAQQSLGMPPLPAQQPPAKTSPGAAARAARQRKRKAEPEVMDERTQRLQKRMVKNRESAARSRQRKQQYTASLEQQVDELKQQNRELLEKVIAHCQAPPAAHLPTIGGQPLRRTRTTPL